MPDDQSDRDAVPPRRNVMVPDLPEVPSVMQEVNTWQERLTEMFGRPIRYEIDWDGFTSHPQQQKNRFAMHLLREHGVDHLYYAIQDIAERNTYFHERFARRVASLRLEHVPRDQDKGIYGRGNTIVLQMHLHEGYKGYLTMPEMRELLPGIIGQMNDLPIPKPPRIQSDDAPAGRNEPEDDTTAIDQTSALRRFVCYDAGALRVVRHYVQAGAVAAVELQLERGALVVRPDALSATIRLTAVPDPDLLTMAVEEASQKPMWRGAIGRRVRWLRMLTNQREEADGVQLEFEKTMTGEWIVQLMFAAMQIKARCVVEFAE